MYFDQFLFFEPYFTLYVPAEGTGMLSLDLAISILSGMVISTSFYEIKNVGRKVKAKHRVGLAGIVAAILAGACPCYYLIPLLAVAGGAGGVLAGLGILFSTFQLPIKFASLLLLGGVTFSLERSLRASCDIRRQD